MVARWHHECPAYQPDQPDQDDLAPSFLVPARWHHDICYHRDNYLPGNDDQDYLRAMQLVSGRKFRPRLVLHLPDSQLLHQRILHNGDMGAPSIPGAN
jgi:hypothetical protein